MTCAPQNGVQCKGNALTISGDEALQRVDQGSMTLILTYDLGSYVQGTLGLQEVPDSGVMLYAEAWAEGRVGSQTKIVRLPEYVNSNNQASLQMTGALSRMNGQQVTQNVEQGADADGNTTADVILKNNGLQPAKVEKLLAALFDAEGYLLELKEVDTSGMTLDGETGETIPVSFTKQGSRVAVYPADSRDTLIFDGLPVRMGSFTYDEESGTYQYTLSDVTVRGSLVTAYSAGGGAVTINNKELPSGGSQWVQFTELTNTITVTLGGNTYVLTVNMDPSMVSDAEYPIILKDPVGATYELNETAERWWWRPNPPMAVPSPTSGASARSLTKTSAPPSCPFLFRPPGPVTAMTGSWTIPCSRTSANSWAESPRSPAPTRAPTHRLPRRPESPIICVS